jgi:hypothetical protein
MIFNIFVAISIEAKSRVLAEQEAKRIYAGIDNVVAEQNDPKTTSINLMLLHHGSGIVRTITSERVK